MKNLEKLADLMSLVEEINSSEYGFRVELIIRAGDNSNPDSSAFTRFRVISPTKQRINGINVAMQQVKGSANWYFRFTDPRTHERDRVATGCYKLDEAWAFTHKYFAFNYACGQTLSLPPARPRAS